MKTVARLGVITTTVVAWPWFCAPRAVAAEAARFTGLDWNWEPGILASLAVVVFCYVRGVRRLDVAPRARVFGGLRCAAFAGGIVSLFAVLISPFDALDDQLFSAHMAQHLVLLMVAPPLMVFGRTGLACLWALPLRARRALGRFWARSGLRRAAHEAMSPLFVWILCSSVLWFWHLPGPNGWALARESVHAFEHICFFATSLMFWSLILEPLGRRRMDHPSTLLFVATLGVQNGMLGALLVFARRPLYAAYLPTTEVWGLNPLEDQQLAGLIMWVPASLVHLATLGIIFVEWMRAAERGAISGSSGYTKKTVT